MKAAVFDFDGTLADTMDFWNNLAKRYLISIGKRPLQDLDDDLEKLTLEQGISHIKEKYNIEKTEKNIQDEMDQLLVDYYKKDAKLKPYVLETLEKLKNKGVKMAIASVIDEELILSVLKRYDITSYFEFIQTCKNVDLNKDDKMFFDILPKKLDLKVNDIYIFEDTLYPIVSAKEAGLKVVGVEDSLAGKNKEEIIKVSDIYINDFSEFIDLIDNMVN